MSSTEQTCSALSSSHDSVAGIIDRLARSLVLKPLSLISDGQLTLVESDRTDTFGTAGASLQATLRVRDPGFYRRIAFGGTIGAGEAYMDHLWDCDDLPALIRIMVRNQEAQQRMENGAARFAGAVQRLLHRLNDNTRSGSRKNIAAHYDLGNDFYRLFLDPTMAYSCGIFERDDSTLEEASTAKFDRICRKLGLTAGMKVLEIGTGWGGFAIHAARNYGCHVTTTTISRQQHDFAARQIAVAGLDDRITLLLQDYRDLTEEFDRLVSIEMIEAVGDRHLPEFFGVCCQRLKTDGAALIQAITTPDRNYDRYLKTPDFINRCIFPGSCCPSPGAMSRAIAKNTDLRLAQLDDLTPHYARTLGEWRSAFRARLDEVRAMGYDERFIRMWDFYLCYCQGGFAEQYTGLLHLLYARPDFRVESPT